MKREKDRFGMLLMEIQRHWRGIMDSRLRPLGLTQAKWRALLHLSRFNEGLKQTDLAAHIGIETPTLVKLLDRLEKDGWVKRYGSPSDRRAKVVRLTAKSAKIMDAIGKTAQATRDELCSAVSPKEMAQAVSVLAKLKVKAEHLHRHVKHRP